MTNPRSMNAEDLVAYLHPDDRPDPQHAVSAACQVTELLRYLALATDDAWRSLPAPAVANDVALALRDGLPALAEILRHLAARHEEFAADARLAAYDTGETHPGGASFYAAAAAIELTTAAGDVDQLTHRLHTATAHTGMIYLPDAR